MVTFTWTKSFLLVPCITALFLAHQAHSDSPALAESPASIDEIVVTAQKPQCKPLRSAFQL
jgi:hypothetical protein